MCPIHRLGTRCIRRCVGKEQLWGWGSLGENRSGYRNWKDFRGSYATRLSVPRHASGTWVVFDSLFVFRIRVGIECIDTGRGVHVYTTPSLRARARTRVSIGVGCSRW